MFKVNNKEDMIPSRTFWAVSFWSKWTIKKIWSHQERLEPDRHFKKILFASMIALQNDEKFFLFRFKSSFRSQDIWTFVLRVFHLFVNQAMTS